MSRSLLRVNYEYSSKFKRGAVRDWHPHRAQVAFGSKGEILARSRCFPLCPRKPTLRDAVGMSASCQFQKSPHSIDNLVGAFEPEFLSILEPRLEDHIERRFRRALHGFESA